MLGRQTLIETVRRQEEKNANLVVFGFSYDLPPEKLFGSRWQDAGGINQGWSSSGCRGGQKKDLGRFGGRTSNKTQAPIIALWANPRAVRPPFFSSSPHHPLPSLPPSPQKDCLRFRVPGLSMGDFTGVLGLLPLLPASSDHPTRELERFITLFSRYISIFWPFHTWHITVLFPFWTFLSSLFINCNTLLLRTIGCHDEMLNATPPPCLLFGGWMGGGLRVYTCSPCITLPYSKLAN